MDEEILNFAKENNQIGNKWCTQMKIVQGSFLHTVIQMVRDLRNAEAEIVELSPTLHPKIQKGMECFSLLLSRQR